jgi:hypothetical protein
MTVKAGMIVAAVFISSCTGVRSVQLTPPTPVPPGLIWGYGVEKIRDMPDRSRQSAYLKAMDDLLTRGPVVVSKIVQDHTTVLDLKSASRTMESTFRLRASRMIQPGFMDTGVKDGFVWVLVGTTQQDIERGWQQFVEWRAQKIDQAQKLFDDAKGLQRMTLLKSSLALLEEAGAADDGGMLYYQVKATIAELENLQKQVRILVDSGQLVAAERMLDQVDGEQFRIEIEDRRRQAAQLIAAGDALFRDEQYKEAYERYLHAQRLDRDNPQLPTKLAMADRYQRTARAQTIRSAAGVIGVSTTHVLSEYFSYKREQEKRKRAEAEKAAADAKKKEQKESKKIEKTEPEKGEEAPAELPPNNPEERDRVE